MFVCVCVCVCKERVGPVSGEVKLRALESINCSNSCSLALFIACPPPALARGSGASLEESPVGSHLIAVKKISRPSFLKT